MDSHCRFLTLDMLWAKSVPSRDINTATQLAQASLRCVKKRLLFMNKSHALRAFRIYLSPCQSVHSKVFLQTQADKITYKHHTHV